MYYSSGNYEAFARPRKPKGVEQKSAYIVGAGLAGLAAAAFLVRDGQMDGRRITIFDAAKLAGGAMDGIKHSETGYRIRGDREQEDHMECLWDLMRSIPSIELEGASVLDEFYWLNKEDPTYSLRRATRNRGEPIPMADKMTLSPQALRELATLAITRDEDLYDKRVSDVVGQEFLDSNFWLFFKTMFAMIPCHSALELKLYLNRFVHMISGMHDLSGITFTRYNQYESFIVPWVKWLEGHGVTFVYDTRVTNVLFDITAQRKVARRIEWLTAGKRGARDLTENDLVFMTIGSPVENSSWGDQHTPAKFDTEIWEGSIWALWRNIAKQHPSFGRPDKFCTNIHDSTQMTATVTFGPGKVADYIQKISQRNPFERDGHFFTGGNLTFRDFRVVDLVERRTAAPLQGTTARRGRQLDHRSLPRQAWQLRAEADVGVHRRGNRPGVALPHGGAGRGDRQPGDLGDLQPLHVAVLCGFLSAASCRRPAGRGA